jgi:hypothetical protein
MDVYQRRRLVALSALAGFFIVVVLLIRSCGGDDEESPVSPVAGSTAPAPTSLSQEDYITQADEICRQTNTLIAEIDTADLNEAANEQGADIANQLDQLQTLPAPTDGQDQLDNFLQALQSQVDDFEKRSLAVERGDDAAVAALDTKIDEDEAEAATAAEKFGFNACGDLSKVSDGGSGADEATTTTTTEESAGGTVTPTVPVTPTTTTPVAPPTDTGTATPPTDTGTATPPADGTDSGSGGITP